MPYCTITDLTAIETLAKLVQLSQDLDADQEGAAKVDEIMIDAAIASADADINGYLRGHVTMPLPNPVPDLIRNISTALSVYYLYLRRYGSKMPDTITAREKRAHEQLVDIRDGRLIISEVQEATQPAGTVKVKAPERIFSQEKLNQYL